MDVSSVGSTFVATGSGNVPARSASPVADSTTPSGTTAPASTSAPSSVAPSSSQVGKAVKQINDSLSQKNQNIYASIGVDKATGTEVVKIIDQDTGDVVSQYPSKAAIALAQSLQQPQGSGGQLLSAKA
jgi:flagellar protein FlaG